MATYLDRILAAHRAAAAADKRDLGALADQARAAGAGRGFAAPLTADRRMAVIAEVKRASPSLGLLAPELDPAELATAYAAGGAAALSVLTDRQFFQGSPEDLAAARAATPLPVLRKDFTVGPADVFDTRRMGADAVLLIAAALSPEELPALINLAASVGLDALVEVHDEAEADRALTAGATLVGVNQRDLVTFDVDHQRAVRVGRLLPETVTRVAESGIRHADDVRRLADAGFDAVLVGEALVKAAHPAEARAGASRRERGASRWMMFVKVCGTTNEDDALLAVALGADAVGFVFAPSPRQVAPQLAADIVKRLPPEIVTVGVFQDEPPERVLGLAQRAGVRAVQLHGHEPPATARWLGPRLPMVIQAFPAGDARVRRAAEYGVQVVLLDAPNPGSGQVFDWSLAAELPPGPRLMIAGGLNSANVAAAIAQAHPWGVDAVSGIEREPGRKDPIKMREFIAAVRAAAPDDEDVEPGPHPVSLYDWQDEG